MRADLSLTIEPSHPSLAGHFPGDPIVPGAVLLDHAVACIEHAYSKPVDMILVAKFLAPVRPLESVAFELSVADGSRVNVTASVASAPVFTLSVLLGE